jgi:hypothetical protein
MTQLTKDKDIFNSTDTRIGSSTGRAGSRSSAGENNAGYITDDFKIFTYDASAPSGSRFTEITNFEDELIVPSDAGDRIYFGAPFNIKPWSIYTFTNIIKSAEKYICKYYSIVSDDLIPVSYMATSGDCYNQNNKSLWETSSQNHLFINKNIDADWAGKDNVLDKIPSTGVPRNWIALEVPVGGIATPARVRDFAYRDNGKAQIDCNQQDILFGITRVKISHKIPAISFWNGGTPNTQVISITSTLNQTVHNLRNALGDSIKAPYSFSFGIDTSTPIEIAMSYTSSQAINTADLELNLKTVSHTNGTIGACQLSDRIITKNINTSGINTVQSVVFLTDYDISNFKEADLMFIQLKRTDNNGGSFYPLEFCINYTAYKMGKF